MHSVELTGIANKCGLDPGRRSLRTHDRIFVYFGLLGTKFGVCACAIDDQAAHSGRSCFLALLLDLLDSKSFANDCRIIYNSFLTHDIDLTFNSKT
jgi:hypothetical protein